MADGTTRIDGYSLGADCAATLACLRALGVDIIVEEASVPEPASTTTLTIEGRGLGGLAAPAADLDTANSGTTMRLMAGILAAHPFQTRLTGDASLSRRPMRRIIDPLRLMGATVDATDADRPPLTVHGAPLQGIDLLANDRQRTGQERHSSGWPARQRPHDRSRTNPDS